MADRDVRLARLAEAHDEWLAAVEKKVRPQKAFAEKAQYPECVADLSCSAKQDASFQKKARRA